MHRAGEHLLDSTEGSALLSTLALVTVVSILVGSVLAIELFGRRMAARSAHELQAYYLARGAIHRHLTNEHAGANAAAGEGTGEVQLDESPFGGFRVLRAAAAVGSERSVVLALAAQRPSRILDHALVTTHDGSTLTLTGSAEITGDILTGTRGVLTRPLGGRPFRGFHRGTVRRRPDMPPAFFNTTRYAGAAEELRRLLPRSELEADAVEDFEAFQNATARQDTIRVFGDLVIPEEGRVVFRRAKTIAVSGGLKVEGALFLCPETRIVASGDVVVSGRVVGSHAIVVGRSFLAGDGLAAALQVVATDSVALTGSGYLRYPSAAVVLGWESDGVRHARITLSDSSRVEGLVAIAAADEDIRDEAEIVVGPAAVVEGVLVGTRMEVLGTVRGTAIGSFGFYESPTTYVNWVRSGTYDVGAKRREMLFADGLAEAGAWDVAWLTELGPGQAGVHSSEN